MARLTDIGIIVGDQRVDEAVLEQLQLLGRGVERHHVDLALQRFLLDQLAGAGAAAVAGPEEADQSPGISASAPRAPACSIPATISPASGHPASRAARALALRADEHQRDNFADPPRRHSPDAR